MRRAYVAALALTASLAGLPVAGAPALEPKAVLQGELPKPLRQELERTVGTSKGPPRSRIDAHRRAREAAEAVIAVLRSEGYYDYEVEPDLGEGDKPAAVVRVRPGPRTLIGEAGVDWTGAAPDQTTAAAAKAALDLTPGAPGRAADVIAAEGRIVAILHQRGYADASVGPRRVVVDHSDHQMQATLVFAPGGLVHLDGVKVLGRSRTRPGLVARLAPWKPGEVYSPEKIAKLERRLRETAVFKSLTVSLAPADQAEREGERPVIVDLADRPPHTIELGGGYATTEGFGVDGRWLTYNQLGLADTTTITGRLAQIQQKLDAELAIPDFFGSDQVFRTGGDVFGDNTPGYNDVGLGVRANIVHNYSRTTFTTLGTSVEAVDTSEKHHINPNGLAVGQHLKLIIFGTTGAVTLDKSNDPLNPTRGWRVHAEVDPTYVTGDRIVPFVKMETWATAYQPLGPTASTVFAERLRLASIVGGGQVLDIPSDLRFYAGGGGSVRGYKYQGVGPQLANGEPLGGISLFETSLEVRQHVTGPWSVVGFVDGGDVGPSYVPNFKQTQFGAGLGVRYNLGFGPIRFDVATPLMRRKGDPLAQVYISIGQSF